ncbi:chloride channel protein [Pedobacter sp.]|uniref:chloride channel protein n=1 Tax=Pedobacter sp. TaxID=1411316 RepID=UPI003D7FFABD
MHVKFLRYIDTLNQYRRTKISNRNFLIIAALVVGIISGCVAAVLKSLTHHIEEYLQTGFQWHYKYYLYFFFPFIGILLSVMYTRRFIRIGKFETGLSPVLFTIAKKSSRVESHNIYSQVITSALTVGFGGSVGLESPLVTSGSAIGSAVGKFLGLSYREITMLLSCGAAAGIASAFNSPIAGALFAIEILLPEFTIPAFIPLLLSAATASVVARFFYSEQLFVLVTEGWVVNAIPYYIILSVFIGLFSIYFTKVNYLVKNYFKRIDNPYRKVVIGGLFLGIMLFLFPALYGEGYVTIRSLLSGNYDWIVSNSIFSEYTNIPFVLVLITVATLFAKSFATLVTLNAGGNGGMFAPSLFMGGLIGFIFAYTINLTGLGELNVVNFIVAGMAAALSGIMHAPLTGIFLIAEITGGYILMVPLMITSSISYLISRNHSKYSIHTKSLAESDSLLSHEDKDTTVLRMMKLRYLIEKDNLVLKTGDILSDRLADMMQSKRNLFAVVDEENHLMGLVYMDDVFKLATNDEAKASPVSNIMHTAPDVIREDYSLKQVLSKMEASNLWVLPVVSDNGTFIGFVSKTAIFNKYRALLTRQADYLE